MFFSVSIVLFALSRSLDFIPLKESCIFNILFSIKLISENSKSKVIFSKSRSKSIDPEIWGTDWFLKALTTIINASSCCKCEIFSPEKISPSCFDGISENINSALIVFLGLYISVK